MFSIFKKARRCTKCNSKDVHSGQYYRAWNALCEQAAGEHGYYCRGCGNIDFDTPNFDDWISWQPRWIVVSHGDAWREELPPIGENG